MYKQGDLYTNKESTLRIDEVGDVFIKCSTVNYRTNSVFTGKVFYSSVDNIIRDCGFIYEGNYTNPNLVGLNRLS